MDIRILLYVVILLLGTILAIGKDPKEKKRKWYVIIIISLLVLESCLRNVVVGPDTISYEAVFQNTFYMSWSEIFDSFKTAYVEGEGKDPGFIVFIKMAQIFSSDFNVFLFICALPFFIPLGLILYRCSSGIQQLIFAFTLYVALFHIVALSGVRQQIATGFCFMAFLRMGNNHFWQAVVLILIGSLVHISALFFLLVPAVGLLSSRILKTLHLISFATIPSVIAYAAQIMLFLASFLANDYYTTYGYSESRGGVTTYIILLELLSVFCFIAINNRMLELDRKKKLLYTMLPMLTITSPLITLNGAMIRVGQYFTLYMMLLVPIAIDAISKRSNERTMIYIEIIFVLIYLSLNSGDFEYYFFWQHAV